MASIVEPLAEPLDRDFVYIPRAKKTVLSALQLLEITYIEIIPKDKKKKANTNLPLYIVKITPYFALEAAEGNKSKLSSFTSSSTPVFVEIPLFRF